MGAACVPRAHDAARNALTRRSFAALALSGIMALPCRAAAPVAEAMRVAALDWAGAEALVALGTPPIAVADVQAFRRQFAHSPLPASVVDLGGRWQPNLELLAQLAPDLILVSSGPAAEEALQARIAPRLAMSLAGTGLRPLAAAEEALRRVARAVRREDAAEAVIAAAAELFGSIARNRTDPAGPPLVVTVLEPDGRHATIYGEHSLIGDCLARCGLRNGWELRTASPWGYSRVAVERLAFAPDSRICFVDQGARTARALRLLNTSPLWLSLPQVAAGHVSPLPNLFPFGGLPTAVRLASALLASEGGRDG